MVPVLDYYALVAEMLSHIEREQQNGEIYVSKETASFLLKQYIDPANAALCELRRERKQVLHA
jgi:hypothetical protein